MPKIPEYNSQAQMSGRPQTETGSQSLNSIQAESKGRYALIDAAVKTGSNLYNRAAQEEVSDLNAKFAEARATWQSRIDEETKNGSVDTQKLEQDFEDFAYKMNEGISTAEGRSFFERQTARLKSSVIRSGAKAQAYVAGVKAEQDLKTSLQNNTLALQRDPTLFKDIYEESMDFIDTKIATGGIPAIHRDKFRQTIAGDLAESTIQGMAQQDPDQAMHALESGQFDEFISGDQRGRAQSYIKAQREVKRIEAERAESQARKYQQKQSEAWQQGALPELAKGSLNTDAILKSPMSADEKIRWLKLASEAAKDTATDDPRVYNEAVRRALLPDDDPKKIRGISDLSGFVGRGLSIQKANEINNFIQKTPEASYDRDNRKRLLDYAETKLVKGGSVLGLPDPDGEYNMSRFTVALQREEDKLRKEGKDPGLLYDPEAKEYFGSRIAKYQLNQQQVMERLAAQKVREMQPQQSPAAPGTTGQAPAPPSEDYVRVQSPEGKTGKVPRSELQQYLMQGFREI
jgi:hypothetical protein